MRPNSLAFRLFAAAAAWALVVLPITAFILISVYRGAVEHNFDTRLNVYLIDLVTDVAEARNNPAAKPPSITDPLFNRPFSGWYWQITPLGSPTQLLYTSESLVDQRGKHPSELGIAADENLTRHANMRGPDKHALRVLEREITIEEGSSVKTGLSIVVSGNSDEIEKTITEFRTLLILALTVLGVGLVLATYFQVRFGLMPLRAIGRGLAAIRSGDAHMLEGDLPTEIVPLQSELNALIKSNRAIIERARTHVGNLAHALKTPLSVITNEAAGKRTSFAAKISDQAEIMRDQITHHLNRASMAARSGVIGGQTQVQPVVKALVRALNRIYEERKLTLRLECSNDVVFHGEKHDLEEMVGNLLDNACKWAKSDISLIVRILKNKIVIRIEDDGPGLPKKERVAALKRGRRLDETKPGSGLGLSIVAELTHLYNGKLIMEESEKGGLSACLELPGS